MPGTGELGTGSLRSRVLRRRLPEVGKSLGRTIVEFKKGLSAASDELAKGTDDDLKVLKVKPQSTLKDPQQVKRIASSSDEP